MGAKNAIVDSFNVQVIDDGYADTKSRSEDTGMFITPSYVTGWRPIYDNESDLNESKKSGLSRIEVEVNGSKYLVGECAIRQDRNMQWNGAADKHNDTSFDILLKTHLSLMSKKPMSRVKLVMGLPVKATLDKERIEKMRAKVIRQHSISMKLYGQKDFENKIIKVEDLLIKAQPHGTLCELILDSKGNIINKDMARKVNAISDIGGKTHNLYLVDALEPLSDFCETKNSGMYTAYMWVQDYIEQELHLYVGDGQIPYIVAAGHIKGYDLTPVIEKAYKSLARKIILEIQTVWENAFPFIENIIFTGGGASILKPYLEDEFKNAMYLSRTQNPSGLFKQGVRKWKRNAG
ncbi:ParM/StbA family protein [Clostridium brassicae]|uniref:ParM/StbA family protein n=1 Tax=Clostridium brassicae TaxID=2999072 RepID=A0ABT4DD15_9CLOT|nr:ParM/StbA family protein [Clostridium brassicae]MCY6960207.1 ParM/StbA family protein [Clostridium brassicae]